MLRYLALASVLAASGVAQANGRPAGTSTINFRQGHEQDIAAGLTFGVVFSHDGGATWHWMCEKAVLYGGMWDPDYAYTSSGAIFATTFDGALVMRDGCVFGPTPFAKKMISAIGQGPDDAVYFALADAADTMGYPGDAKIYKSTDNGMTVNTGTTAGVVNDWYRSIEVAPTDASRVYVAGYRLSDMGQRSWQIYRSNNGGTSFTPVTSTGFTASNDSNIDIVGIKRNAPDTLFVKVSLETGSIGDAIWRSDNAGQTWTKIFPTATNNVRDDLSFVIRANGDLVVGTRNSGMFVARGPNNTTWEAVAGSPHVNCLVENAAGEVWACTQNYGVPGTPADDAGIMKSTNLTAWTKVLRYQDIAGPVDCAVGTRQHDQCVYDCPDQTYADDPTTCPNDSPKAWCVLKNQMGITATAIACPALFDEPPSQDVTAEKKPGCCSAGSEGAPLALALSLGVGTVILRRRRKVR